MPEVFKMGRNVLEESVGLNFKSLGPLAKSATSPWVNMGWLSFEVLHSHFPHLKPQMFQLTSFVEQFEIW